MFTQIIVMGNIVILKCRQKPERTFIRLEFVVFSISHKGRRCIFIYPEQSDDKPIDELILQLFSHFEKHRDFYSLMNERGLTYLLKDVIVKISGLKRGLPKIEAYSKAFFAYSLYGWTETWFQRGMEESAEEMAGLFKMQGI